MKRKLVIIGDMRYMMKEIFGLDDLEVDNVKGFMERDFTDIFDVIKEAARSDLTDRQKMLVAYICGNTSGMHEGMNEAMNLDNITRKDADNDMINFAG